MESTAYITQEQQAAREVLLNFLETIGLNSCREVLALYAIENFLAKAQMDFGRPDTIMMNAQTYRAFQTTLSKENASQVPDKQEP